MLDTIVLNWLLGLILLCQHSGEDAVLNLHSVHTTAGMMNMLYGHWFPPLTVFDLITAHTPISAQSSNSIVFRLSQCIFCLFLYKGICCGYPFELHRQVDAIQMGTHNICLYKEKQKHKHIA